MGTGMAQVAVLLVLTVFALPLAFFALMSALDRFERRLDPSTEAAAFPAAASPPAASPTTQTAAAETENAAADVVPLPVTTPATAPTAAAI